MSGPLLLGIDEGTTAVKAALFDCELNTVAQARRTVALAHPRPGWVQQDPELIVGAVVDALAEVLEHAARREVVATGLDHQGESVLAWDADGARPLTPVVVWQDKRQESLLANIDPSVSQRSHLPLDPYFSAGKLAWLLEHDKGVSRARDAGSLRLGTVDAFLVDRLGARFATDLSTASRTQLLAFAGRDWDDQLLSAFGLRREWLPTIGPTFGALGRLHHERWPQDLALTAQLVDQQAALAGSGAVAAGELKATYGTGVFVLGRSDGPTLAEGLLPTVAWAAPGPGDGAGAGPGATDGLGEVAYALDGGVFAAGALLDWLSHGLGLARDTPSLVAAAAGVNDSAGAIVLPALAGLGAPWWQPQAHGVIAGLHPGIRPAHIARAALEAIAWRVADIVEAMAAAGPVTSMRVDGGLSADPTLLRLQADALGMDLLVGRADTTVLGAAILAGVGAEVFDSVDDAALRLPPPTVVRHRDDPHERTRAHDRWRAFVAAGSRL